MADRTVHGGFEDITGRLFEVVRYDRAGKWFLEHQGGGKRVTVAQAAQHCATFPNAWWTEGLPGGQRFDSLMRRLGGVDRG